MTKQKIETATINGRKYEIEVSTTGAKELVDNVKAAFAELAELRAWKESALAVSPPLQEIADAIGVPLGASIHDKILPWILEAKARLARIESEINQARREELTKLEDLMIASASPKLWSYGEILSYVKRRVAQLSSVQQEAPPETNPADCNCEHLHASSSTCRSKEISHGAVKEKDRLFPAAAPTDISGERIWCMSCGKSVSTPVPKNTIVRAFVECPECIEKRDIAAPQQTTAAQREGK